MSQTIPEEPVLLHCLDFHSEDRLPPRVHVGQPCGKASWESLVGKTRGKAIDPLTNAAESVTLLLPPWRKAKVHAPSRDEDSLPWGDSRSTPRYMSALERYPQVPAPNPHMVLDAGIDCRGIPRGPRGTRMGTGLPEAPERVPEVPAVSREHLPKLEKILEVLPSRRDQAHFH